ncbi:MAG: asparagine synthase-related protein [Luteimonas sp.]
MSPYFGPPDFAAVEGLRRGEAALDLVSLADVLRNGFVYPPHSIFEDVKVATFGFDPAQDMRIQPEFRFGFRDAGKRGRRDDETDWVGAYHQRLSDAYGRACSGMRSPWLLQSGGKDSTPLAIVAAEARPDTTCITYLGGSEENEIESAKFIARKLGLRHESLVCDPGRAYDRYLAHLGRMPLLTADFALLSYMDLATTIAESGGDGVVDGMGADNYFGIPVGPQHYWLSRLAREVRLPAWLMELPLLGRSFKACYALATLQMNPVERIFPGSRFSNAEVDALFGRPIAERSRARLELFGEELASATSDDERVAMALTVAGATGGFAKGLCSAEALSLVAAYPFCDAELREWVYREVPSSQMIDPATRTSKILMRRHIATRFDALPYVRKKGSFRFDLCGLAARRFDRVHAFAAEAADVLPGARPWLDRNRKRLHNKYHASKFYLLAVVLPWLTERGGQPDRRTAE